MTTEQELNGRLQKIQNEAVEQNRLHIGARNLLHRNLADAYVWWREAIQQPKSYLDDIFKANAIETRLTSNEVNFNPLVRLIFKLQAANAGTASQWSSALRAVHQYYEANENHLRRVGDLEGEIAAFIRKNGGVSGLRLIYNQFFDADDPSAITAPLHAGAVLGMVDRTFGGRGLAPEVMPQRLPLSADLMVTRLEQIVIGCLAEALGLPEEAKIEPVRRDGSFTALAAFPEGTPLAVIRVDITEDSREPWPIFLVTSEAALPALLADGAAAPKRIKGRADPASEPFASLPLELTAMLVDMRVSMATVAALEPGKVIPVSVARNVPLKIDGRVIATGSVGAADDSVAIRITQAFT